MKTDYWTAREGNAQSRNTFHLCEQRLIGGRNSQKALHVPLPRQWGRLLRGGDGSFQVVWRTDLEVDLERTQNYCVELIGPMSTSTLQYSMSLACVRAKECPPTVIVLISVESVEVNKKLPHLLTALLA